MSDRGETNNTRTSDSRPVYAEACCGSDSPGAFLPTHGDLLTGDLITLSNYPAGNYNSTNRSIPQLPHVINLPSAMNQTMNMDSRVNQPFAKQPDLSKCKINFDGKSCVREFLIQVEELQYARSIDDAYLVRAFSSLLSDHALKWFRSVRSQITSWYGLKLALLRRFDKNDFDYQLEFQLRTRKQKPKETLSEFIIDLMDMSSQLIYPLSESILIDIFRHNMLPSLMVHFVGRPLSNMDAVVRLSKEIDAYNTVIPHQQTASHSNFEKPLRKFNAVDVKNDHICLKCKRTGHHYKECKSIKGTICFKCNKKDVTTLTCDNCNSTSSNVPKATSPKNE
jgi:hypothetical protein